MIFSGGEWARVEIIYFVFVFFFFFLHERDPSSKGRVSLYRSYLEIIIFGNGRLGEGIDLIKIYLRT